MMKIGQTLKLVFITFVFVGTFFLTTIAVHAENPLDSYHIFVAGYAQFSDSNGTPIGETTESNFALVDEQLRNMNEKIEEEVHELIHSALGQIGATSVGYGYLCKTEQTKQAGNKSIRPLLAFSVLDGVYHIDFSFSEDHKAKGLTNRTFFLSRNLFIVEPDLPSSSSDSYSSNKNKMWRLRFALPHTYSFTLQNIPQDSNVFYNIDKDGRKLHEEKVSEELLGRFIEPADGELGREQRKRLVEFLKDLESGKSKIVPDRRFVVNEGELHDSIKKLITNTEQQKQFQAAMTGWAITRLAIKNFVYPRVPKETLRKDAQELEGRFNLKPVVLVDRDEFEAWQDAITVLPLEIFNPTSLINLKFGTAQGTTEQINYSLVEERIAVVKLWRSALETKEMISKPTFYQSSVVQSFPLEAQDQGIGLVEACLKTLNNLGQWDPSIFPKQSNK